MQELDVLFKSDNDFMNIFFTFKGLVKGEDELANLFTPSKDNFSYYIIRQIIREHDDRYGYPGLRLDASQNVEGFTIHFSLISK
jgi:hypothetical protein